MASVLTARPATATRSRRHTLVARLCRNPYLQAPAPAVALVYPLLQADDYGRMARSVREGPAAGCRTPVLLSHAQYFEVLADCVRAAAAWLAPEAPVLIELGRGYILPPPPALVQTRVFMLSAALREAAFWACHGARECLVIDARLRRELSAAGDNTLRWSLWTDRDGAARLRRYVDSLPWRAALECPVGRPAKERV